MVHRRRTANAVHALCGVLLIGASVGASEDFAGFVIEGDALVSSSQYTAAAAAYGQAIQLDTKQAYIYTKRATAFAASGQPKLAISDYGIALDLKPDAVSSWVNRGRLHLQLCDFEAAQRDFQRALRLVSNHREASAAKEQVQQAQRNLETAKAELEHHHVDLAMKHLDAVWRVSVDCIPARLLAAQLHLNIGNMEAVVAETGRVLRIEPDNDFDMAKRHYGEVITKYDPEDKEARRLFKQVKDMQKRIAKVETAVRGRHWEQVLEETGVVLPDIAVTQHKLRAKMYKELARAKYYLKHASAQIEEALDAAQTLQYDEELVVLHARTLVREHRYEAAVQKVQEAIESHGKTRKLVDMWNEAKRELKVSKQKDYYKILGVEKDVDEKTLKRWYRKLALKYHPDKVDGDKETAEEKFAEINEAYEVLSDPEKRKMHDMGEDPFSGESEDSFHTGGFHGFSAGFNGGFRGSYQQGGRTFNVRFG